jgi:DNA-binding response OmpR family regulator
MVIVVEQDECARISLSELLTDRGYRVIQAADASEAVQRIDENEDLEFILLDLEMAASARVLEHARRIAPNVIVFGMSQDDAPLGLVEGVDGWFCKPLVFQELYRDIRSAAI